MHVPWFAFGASASGSLVVPTRKAKWRNPSANPRRSAIGVCVFLTKSLNMVSICSVYVDRSEKPVLVTIAPLWVLDHSFQWIHVPLSSSLSNPMTGLL